MLVRNGIGEDNHRNNFRISINNNQTPQGLDFRSSKQQKQKRKRKKVTITSLKPVTTILTICVQVSEKIMIITPALYHHPAVAMAIIPD